MHHPEIYKILAAIEDYFILIDINHSCKVEAISEQKKEDNYIRRGIGIKSDLNHGYLHISIIGQEQCGQEDDDTVTCRYFNYNNLVEPIGTIEVKRQGKYFSIENVRYALTELVKMDRYHHDNLAVKS